MNRVDVAKAAINTGIAIAALELVGVVLDAGIQFLSHVDVGQHSVVVVVMRVVALYVLFGARRFLTNYQACQIRGDRCEEEPEGQSDAESPE